MKQYYECIITMSGDPALIAAYVSKIKWNFKRTKLKTITGSTICRANLKMFGFDNEADVVTVLGNTTEYLTRNGVDIISRKVARIVLDDRRKGRRA